MADGDPALAAVLMSWIRDGSEGKTRMRALLAQVAEGGRLVEGDLAALLGYADDPQGLDEDWEMWLLSRRRSVVTLGVTLPDRIRRFRGRRLISPADSAIWGGGLDAKTFLEPAVLLDRLDEKWIRRAAGAKSVTLSLVAAGRGGRFEEMVAAHCRFFAAVAEGKKSVACERLLQKAEALLVGLEAGLPEWGL